MSEFTPITTQEEFDKAIQKRLAQKEREMAESFKEYMSPDKAKELRADCERKIKEAQDAVKVVEEKLKEKDLSVSEITKRAEAAEGKLLKNRIAYEHKLPLELANRLIGDNEDELKADAEKLATLVRPASAPPLRSSDVSIGATGKNENAGIMQLLTQLNAAQQ